LPRRSKLPPPEEIVAAIVELADDGFCRRGELAQRFPKLGAQDLRRALRRAVAQGLVIERRGPDGGFHLAVSSEGWNLHRSG
jgi:DNA-binding IscR family transcriptional regulator